MRTAIVPSRRPWVVRSRTFITRFYVAAALISIITVLSLVADGIARVQQGQEYGALQRRALEDLDPLRLVKRDEQCRLVHQAKDKCAFIKANCPDEEAGLFSYLSLYYCSLQHAQPAAFALLVVWLCLLFSTIGIAASDFFCVNLSTIASLLGMSESMAGVTFLAFGNGSPDVFSTFAAMSTNSGSLAVGELMGAAGFITAVVAGSMALVREFRVGKKTFVRDVSFFIVAASFTTFFLADGHLQTWECFVMIGFYLFYVVIVVIWHWYFGKKQAHRAREAAARSQIYVPGSEDLEVSAAEEEEPGESTGLLSHSDDWSELERGTHRYPDSDSDDEQRHLAAQMSTNMRVTRRGTRRSTLAPVRPSLVGALEFRSVLSSLQRSRSLHTVPIHLRRYSDDRFDPRNAGPHSAVEQFGPYLSAEDPAALRPHGHSRLRAVSMNDANDVRDVDFSTAKSIITESRQLLTVPGQGDKNAPASPTISITPPPSLPSRSASPEPSETAVASDSESPAIRPLSVPSAHSQKPKPASRDRLRLSIPRPSHGRGSAASSPITDFPDYTESPLAISPLVSRPPSLALPEPSMTGGSDYIGGDGRNSEESSKWLVAWWPYDYLPSPQVLVATLFPTLYMWSEKEWLEKVIGVISAPSIFLLSITLPVVEQDSKDEADENMREPDALPDVSQPDEATQEGEATGLSERGIAGHGNSAEVAVSTERGSPESHPSYRDWNRWLICIQIFTAPLFVGTILWANGSQKPRDFLFFALWSLLGSLVALAMLLLTTSAENAPSFRPLLSFAGFVVSIAWISTIANEVVGVLKTFRVVLGISDAILGLTIFAVGNSLGDLVADVTVARLGYPVMALSACFGGPMLNILLGIGISGVYITTHRGPAHPGFSDYKPYEIDVSPTLIVSAITLVITLVSLLVVVPLNRWMMTRRIGWGLILLWTISTIVNLVVEGTGALHRPEVE